MINKQKFSMYNGIAILVLHIFICIYFWVTFSKNPNLAIAEITTPITAAYAVGVVKWFIDTQGLITKNDAIGIPYAVVIILINGTFLTLLVLGAYFYISDTSINENEINKFYVFVESMFGVMFALIFSDLFGDNTAR